MLYNADWMWGIHACMKPVKEVGQANQLGRTPVERKRGVSHLLLLGIVAIIVLVFVWLMSHPGSTPASQHTLNPTTAPGSTPPPH